MSLMLDRAAQDIFDIAGQREAGALTKLCFPDMCAHNHHLSSLLTTTMPQARHVHITTIP